MRSIDACEFAVSYTSAIKLLSRMPEREEQDLKTFMAAFIGLPLIAYGIVRLLYHLL